MAAGGSVTTPVHRARSKSGHVNVRFAQPKTQCGPASQRSRPTTRVGGLSFRLQIFSRFLELYFRDQLEKQLVAIVNSPRRLSGSPAGETRNKRLTQPGR